MDGKTFIEINANAQKVEESLYAIQGFSWLFEWGMYVFLFLTLAILLWVFYDSINKHKDQQALVPRILAMIGFFAIIPTFIFRFTGTANAVTTFVRLNAEPGTPYYPGPINWNVNWLIGGFGPTIAIIALCGVALSIVAIVIYASSVHRARPATEFVRAINDMDRKIDKIEREQAAAPASRPQSSGQSSLSSAVAQSAGARSNTAKTIIDRKPQAATVIDVPQSGAVLLVQAGSGRGATYGLPAADTVVGRDSHCNIVVDDEKVSREHAKLYFGAQGWSISDLNSVNGTYVNGVKVGGRQVLADGDSIKMGDTILQFRAARG